MKGREKIKQYWNERANELAGEPAATTADLYLRELEISVVAQTLNELSLIVGGEFLDVGCGDGYSTLKVAQQLPGHSFFGVDNSENMIRNAGMQLEALPELKERVAFAVGDVLELGQVCANKPYDFVLTDRCLINLDSAESQYRAVARIAEQTKPRGYYIAIENFMEGHENLNNARRAIGLPEIPVRWHNLYLSQREFVQSVERFFEVIVFKDFSSSYYFATRVIYSKMCQMRGESPDYEHEIHQLAIHLPWTGQFSPIKMAVLRKRE